MHMNELQNKKLMHIVRQLHGLLGPQDISQQRQSQNKLGNLFSNSKKYIFLDESLHDIHCEWTQYQGNPSNDLIILYCHGGGYMTGSCLYARGITTKLAKYSKLSVLSFDYRLAPEHPFPAALEDAITVWNSLLEKDYQSNNIILAGDSAGGNLALSLALHLRDHNLSLPKCILLFSPWTDLSPNSETHYTKTDCDPVLTISYLQKARQNYIGSYPADLPYISPLMADLHDLPPIHIQVGENEILLNDSLLLHEKLLSHSATSHIEVFPLLWHVFQLCPIRTAHNAVKRMVDNIFI